MKTYQIAGTIELTANEIIINENGKKSAFRLMSMKRIEVTIHEIADLSGACKPGVKKGMKNYLTFIVEGEKKKYMFLLQEQSITELRQTLWSWHYSGLPLFLYNFPAENIKI